MTALHLCFYIAHGFMDMDIPAYLLDLDFYSSSWYQPIVPNECAPLTLLMLGADPNIKNNVCLKWYKI